MKINYTFIIPHKNSHELLYRCINSIPVRDDIQIIVIDDNSENQNFECLILQQHNVKLLLSDHNLGAGGARNMGLDYAKGKWVLFADADDYYTSGFIDVLDKYLDTDNDIVFFDIDDSQNPKITFKKYHKAICNQSAKDIQYLKYGMTNVWCKMFKLSLITKYNIKFECTKRGNDILFTLLTSHFSQKILVIKNKLYNYSYSPTSITFSNHLFQDYIDIYKRHLKYNSFVSFIGANEFKWSFVDFFLHKLKYFGLKKTIKFWLYVVIHSNEFKLCKNYYIKIYKLCVAFKNKSEF